MRPNSARQWKIKPADARRVAGILVLCPLLAVAGYKAKPWTPGPPEEYPSRLTSEGITMAAKPFLRDDLAAQVFDSKDMVSRGIMPLAVIVFNHNDFPVTVDGSGIRLLQQSDRLRTLEPPEVLRILFEKRGRGFQIPLPIPRSASQNADRAAVEDFDQKFLSNLTVPPGSTRAGFLFFRIPDQKVDSYLLESKLYVPDVYNRVTGNPLIYFEIDLRAAIESATRK